LTPAGNLIFASLNLVQSVWSLPLDAESAKVTGELKKITDGPMEAQPSISRDGRKLAFVVNQNARPNSELGVSQEPTTFRVRVKDLATGKEAPLPEIKRPQFHPQISRDGTLLAYSSSQEQIEILRIDPGPPGVTGETAKVGKVCDWSADNKRLLFTRYSDPNVYVYDRSARRASLFLNKPSYGLFQARFSPDDRAVLFIGCNSQAAAVGCQIFVAPLKTDGTPATDNWIAIPHSSRWDDKPRWSPDGNLIYFISDRDGQFCLWAQRVQRRSKQLIGTPFPLYHFHNSRLAMNNVGTNFLEIDVSRNKIVMGLGELTGNIWSLQR
jgi:eukaryotic-like serine/threonine-protein kinase